MILNVGPDARGNFPETAVEELRKVGAWLSKNGGSIYNCGHSEIEKPEWGRYTEPLEMQEDKQFRTVYAHVFEPALGALPLFGIRADALESVRLAQRAASFAAGRHGIRCCIGKHRL
jgi:alpha-L-fucosidase